MNGATARRRAATSPVANEPATIQPIFPLDPGSGWDGRSRPLSLGVGMGVGSVVTMDSIHAQLAPHEHSDPHLWHMPSTRHETTITDLDRPGGTRVPRPS